MNAPRLAACLIGAAVCGAWLASAAGVARQSRILPVRPPAPEVVQLDALAAEVQSQAERLRQKLASAPAPRAADRSPFNFDSPAVRRRTPARLPQVIALPEPVQAEIREPVLELIGIAESGTGDALVRTAMITGGHAELMMVTVGQRILSRYDVIAVSADAVELKDVESGATRRLILR